VLCDRVAGAYSKVTVDDTTVRVAGARSQVGCVMGRRMGGDRVPVLRRQNIEGWDGGVARS
jgi:hypothetical protein